MRWIVVAVVALALLAGVGFAFADGGAPPENDGRTRTYRPIVEDVALAEDADGCAIEARLWLAGASNSWLVLRDVEILQSVVATSPAGMHIEEYDVPWTGGWWWRAQSERVDVQAPVPCDAFVATIVLNFAGTTERGARDTHAESFDWKPVEER